MSKSYYKSEKARERILQLYDEKLNGLHQKYRSIYINTSYGTTHVLLDNTSSKPPVLLLHGLNSSAPFILEKFESLKTNFKLIAIDVLGQPNKSDEVRLNKKNDEYGLWMLEIVNYLKLDTFSLLGWSFGAYIALKTVMSANNRIDKLFLVAPAGIVNSSLFKITFKLLLPFVFYKITKNKKFKHFLFFNLGIEKEYEEYYTQTMFQYQGNTSVTPLFTTNQLKMLNNPVSVFIGQNDVVFPPSQLEKKLASLSYVNTFKIVKGGKHVFNKRNTLELAEYILKN